MYRNKLSHTGGLLFTTCIIFVQIKYLYKPWNAYLPPQVVLLSYRGPWYSDTFDIYSCSPDHLCLTDTQNCRVKILSHDESGRLFSPQKRKSCCSNGCNHHGYHACVHTQTKDYEYYSRFESFYCKIKYPFEEKRFSDNYGRPRAATGSHIRVGKVSDCQTEQAGRLNTE